MGVLGLAPLVMGECGADDPRVAAVAWLVKPRYQQTILSELGRITDDDALRKLAVRIAALRPRARTATALIRRFRLGDPIVEPGRLADELVRVINDYVMRYPSTNTAAILGALEVCAMAVRAAASDAEAERKPARRRNS